MGRWLLILASTLLAMSGSECSAQWWGGWGWGGYYGGGSTPYSNAVNAEAQYIAAYGQASEDAANAAIAAEQARSRYIENQAQFQAMRREQRAAAEAKKEQREAEAKARAAKRPPAKPMVDRYPRLASDQLDPLTGEIQWPDCLSDGDYASDRTAIESALKSQAEIGANARDSKIIYDAAHRMMALRSRSVASLGSEGYSSCRKFLNSLALEGEHAQEAQR